MPPGRVPRYKDVLLLGDLTDCARPGEEVDVTGIYAHAQMAPAALSRDKTGFPVFSTGAAMQTLLLDICHISS